MSLALFALSLMLAALTASGQVVAPQEEQRAIDGFGATDDSAELCQDPIPEQKPEAQERGKGKDSQPQGAETVPPSPDSKARAVPAKPVKPRRKKSAKRSEALSAATETAQPAPTPPIAAVTPPFPEPANGATPPLAAQAQLSAPGGNSAAATNAASSLTATSSSTLNPASGGSALSLPVVLGLIALVLAALTATVVMLIKQLRVRGRAQR